MQGTQVGSLVQEDPHAVGQQNSCVATTEPTAVRSPLTATRESPCTAVKIKKKKKKLGNRNHSSILNKRMTGSGFYFRSISQIWREKGWSWEIWLKDCFSDQLVRWWGCHPRQHFQMENKGTFLKKCLKTKIARLCITSTPWRYGGCGSRPLQ